MQLKQTFVVVDDHGQEHEVGVFSDPLPSERSLEETVTELRSYLPTVRAFRNSPELDEVVRRAVKKRICSPKVAPCGKCRICRWKREKTDA